MGSEVSGAVNVLAVMDRLVRYNVQLGNRHEYRRGAHRTRPVYCNDLLRSMKVWRSTIRTGDHSRRQYELHRKAALQGYPLAQLRMIESAINCDLACRDALQAWRAAA